MMKSVILLLIAIEAGLVAAADVNEIVTTALAVVNEIRSELTPVTEEITNTCDAARTQALLGSYPDTCDYSSVDVDQIRNFNPNELDKFGGIFCPSQCGDPIVEFLRECLSNSGQNFVNFFSQFCAVSSQNSRCHTASFLTSIRASYDACEGDTASQGCCAAATLAVTTTGCCVNLLNVGGLVSTTSQIPSSCVAIPQTCGGTTLMATTTATGATTGATTTGATTASGAVKPTLEILSGALVVLTMLMVQVFYFI